MASMTRATGPSTESEADGRAKDHVGEDGG